MVSIIPLNDEGEHERTANCACAPKVLWSDPDTGRVYPGGPLVIHNAFDCREAVERLLAEKLAADKGWGVYED